MLIDAHVLLHIGIYVSWGQAIYKNSIPLTLHNFIEVADLIYSVINALFIINTVHSQSRYIIIKHTTVVRKALTVGLPLLDPILYKKA